MSVNLKSLQIVIDLARRKRDQWGAQVAAAHRELQQAQDQLAQLSHFADEGQTKWLSRAAEGVTPVLMQHHNEFALKIQHAIDFQGRVIGQREGRLQAELGGLQAAERELATLEKVAEHSRLVRQKIAHKAEQKLNDEMAMTMLAHQRRLAEQEHAP
jgi:flagellar FliJ protein